MRKWTTLAVLVLGLIGLSIVTVKFYPYIFSKVIKGEIVKVERVSNPQTIVTGDNVTTPSEQLFSFAVAIRDKSGDIHTASSEDRQWAVAQAGQCAEAKFFPYPPWNLDKAGTYYNARLIGLSDCK